MPSFDGVAAAQTATLKCPIGLTYHQLLVTYTGVTLAQMDEIRVIANGQTIQKYTSGTQLNEFNQFYGRAAASGILIIDFERYGLTRRDAREITALGTGKAQNATTNPNPISTLNVEIDINAGAAAPVLSARAIQSGPAVTGLILKRRSYAYSPAASGDFEISDLPKGDLINSIVFGLSLITNLKIERDNFIVFDRTDADNNLVLNDGVRVSGATVGTVYDPTENGDGADGLATRNSDGTLINDLRFVVTVSGAGTLPVSVESIGLLEN